MKLASYSPDLLFVITGDRIRVINRQWKQAAQIRTLEPPLHVESFVKSDGTILLAASSSCLIEVFLILAETDFEKVCGRSIPPNLMRCIVSLHFLDESHLAVLWNDALELFELRPGDLEPFQRFTSDSQTFSSAIFFERDGQFGTIISVVPGGQLAIELISHSPKPETKLSNLITIPKVVAVGYSDTSDVVFLTRHEAPMMIGRLDDLLFGGLKLVELSVRGFGELHFCCEFPNANWRFLFIHPGTNGLYTIEITDTAIELSRLPAVGGFRLFEHSLQSGGWFVTGTDVFVISGTGQARPLREREDLCVESEYRVPPTFWSSARILGPDVAHLTGTDRSQDYNTLFKDSVTFFHTNVGHRVMSCHVNDPTDCIVGIMLSFGNHGEEHRPSWVSLNGRKYETSVERNYMLPLLLREVRPGAKVDLEFAPDTRAEIAIQSVILFGLKASELPSESALDWRVDSWSITDFSDDVCGVKEEPEVTLSAIAMAVDAQPNDDVDEGLVQAIVGIMYSQASLTLMARSILVRLCNANPEVVKLWGAGLRSVLAEKKVAETLWDWVWRDFELFDDEIRQQLKPLLWDGSPNLGSLQSIVAAFTC
jgi:hypothetical protein